VKNQTPSKININYNLPDYYQGGSLYVFICFLVFIVFKYLQGGYRFPVLGSIRFEFLLGSLLVLLSIPAYFNNPNRPVSGVGLGFWIVSFFLIITIMSFFSYTPEISYDIFIDRVFKFALVGFFIVAFVTTPARLAFFLGAVLLAYMKMGQEGLLGVITGSLVWQNQGIPRLHGSTPIYRHPNSFSGMALGCLPFLFYFYGVVHRYLKLILLIQFVFVFNIILFTGSRTGYVAMIIGIILIILKSNNRGILFLIILLIGFVSIKFVPEPYIKRVETIFTQKDIEGGSIDSRKQILGDAWQIFIDNPLGIGVGAFPAVRENLYGRSQDTHNLYLEVATNLGVQGLIIFLGLIFSVFRLIFNLQASLIFQIRKITRFLMVYSENPLVICSGKLREHLQDLRIMYATCLSIFIFIVIRLVLGFFGMDLYEIYWWFTLGVVVALWNMNSVAQYKTAELCDDSLLLEDKTV